jgi:ABC-type multidrug transport system ATPase subunit
MPEVIRLAGVGKRYPGNPRWVLRDVDLSLAGGALIAVSAANGAGKSTLLRIIAGLSLPTTGAVTGRPAIIGYVPERLPASLPMTVRQYLTHMGRIRGLSSAKTARRVAELVELLSVAPHPDAEMRTLSKGNTQKVAVA